ncbi:hypothetical protein DB346_00840 [Verrucomicrobia bacterium LW23]|nr:hypothetical protein DB346_00840 [Verrucomicrobia bacterium LW23]
MRRGGGGVNFLLEPARYVSFPNPSQRLFAIDGWGSTITCRRVPQDMAFSAPFSRFLRPLAFSALALLSTAAVDGGAWAQSAAVPSKGGSGGMVAPAEEKPASPYVPYGPLKLNSAVWANGEVLRYEIRWGMVLAAEGTFVARDGGATWRSELFMRTRAAGESIYPIRTRFSSTIQKAPWRSLEYRQDRREPKRTLVEENKVDYTARSVRRDRISRKSVDTFTFTQDALEDLGSMLYSLRTGDWQPGTKRGLVVYEDGKVKQGEAVCLKRAWMRVGSQPPGWVLVLDCKPTIPAQKGGLVVWMSDTPERIPLRAELKFRYGTFTMDLATRDNVVSNPGCDPARLTDYALVLPAGTKAGPGQ